MRTPLNLIPQMVDGVQVRAESWPWYDMDVVVLEKGHSWSCNMWTSVMLLENVMTMLADKWNNVGSDDLVNVKLGCDVVSTTLTHILEAQWSKSRIKSNPDPYHDRRSTRASLSKTFLSAKQSP